MRLFRVPPRPAVIVSSLMLFGVTIGVTVTYHIATHLWS